MSKKLILSIIIAVILIVAIIVMTLKKNVDLLLINSTAYTLDKDNSKVEAIAIKDGKIFDLGSSSEIMANYKSKEIIDLSGCFTYPGFTDGHAHILGEGGRLQTLDLVGTTSVDQILEMVKKKVSGVKNGDWIIGRGWDQNNWPRKEFPTAKQLDEVAPSNPVLLRRIDGHAAWVNSLAMKIASIDNKTEDPVGGKIIHDSEGKPTGVFIDNAIDLIGKAVPSLTNDEIKERLKLALNECAKYGLTEVHDMGVDRDIINQYKNLIDAKECPIRIYAAIDYGGPTLNDYFQRGPEIGYGNGLLTIRAIKLYMDGALGSRGAALIDAYNDDPNNRGLTMMSDSEMDSVCREALVKNFQVCTHAIGDRANNLTLNAYERILKTLPEGAESPRWRIEHAQILMPSDIGRFKKNGILPSMQPTHATSDMDWVESRIGAERAKGAYAWRSILETGSIIIGGSDFPVEFVNPLLGFYAAITRQDVYGLPSGGWYPEQVMNRDEALNAFTKWPAYGAFQEKEKGTVEIGKWADLTILSKDIMQIPPEEILNTEVVMTIVGGKIVYRKEDWKR